MPSGCHDNDEVMCGYWAKRLFSVEYGGCDRPGMPDWAKDQVLKQCKKTCGLCQPGMHNFLSRKHLVSKVNYYFFNYRDLSDLHGYF